MIIDSHTHIGFNKVCAGSVTGLLASMNRAGIDSSLVYAGEINDCSNERLIKELSTHPNKLFTVGSVSPLATNAVTIEKVEEWLSGGRIYGLKFYPGYEHFYPYDKILRPYLELLSKYNRPAVFHTGDICNTFGDARLKYAHPLQIDDLASEMPKLKIIVAHFGYPWVTDAAEVYSKNKNVYLDCSGLVYGKFNVGHKATFKKIMTEVDEISGTRDRIIFGTDWPFCDQKSYVDTAKLIFGKKADKFFYKNAAEAFGLDL